MSISGNRLSEGMRGNEKAEEGKEESEGKNKKALFTLSYI